MILDTYYDYSNLIGLCLKGVPKVVFIPKDHHYNANNKRKKGRKKGKKK